MNTLGKCCFIVLFCVLALSVTAQVTDAAAERMLIHQRSNGGWPKLPQGQIDYQEAITSKEEETLLKDKNKTDATIDNNITTLEIKHLTASYHNTKNTKYLDAATKGINYLLDSQNSAGGWGQYFPDTSGYRKHITFNDNAMINVMWLLKKIADREPGFEVFSQDLVLKSKLAIEKGIDCILKCQVRNADGKITVWCAQHNRITLLPAPARTFEPATLSGSESVGIVKFLMAIPSPSEPVKNSIEAAIQWFKENKIEGVRVDWLRNADGKITDRVVLPDSNSTLWARFYDLRTGQPVFTGRDGVPKDKLEEIEKERRMGYSYLGTWPQDLINKEYPKWHKKLSK